MRAKKGTITYYKKKLDIYFSKYIRSLNNGRCAKCGKRDNLQCAHIVSRSNLNLRWDPLNALPLCVKDHLYWAHKNPLEFTEWLQKKYPINFKHVMRNKNKIVKFTLEDYIELYEHYKAKVEAL